MAITTLDGVIAGAKPPIFFSKAATGTLVVGRPVTLWPLAGTPGAGSFNATLNGVNLGSSSGLVNGQIYFQNPTVGQETYLARLQASCTIAGVLALNDRLWHNGGFTITSTAAQNITQPTLPARDADGTSNGRGVLIGVEVSATVGAATPTITMSYTNSDGVAGRTATNILTTASAAPAGVFYQMGLQAGDVGVRSVQSLTLSASWVSGTINLVAYRPIAALELVNSAVPNAIDAVTAGFPLLYDGSVPYFTFVPAAVTTSFIQGSIVYTQG